MDISSDSQVVQYRATITRDFVILSSIVAGIVSSLFLFFAYNTYRTYTTQSVAITHSLEVQSSRINSAFADAIDYTAQSMWHINQQIVKNGTAENFINKLLESYRVPSNDIVAYSTFSWANNAHKVTVTSNQGIMSTPVDLSKRDYIAETIAEPWKIHLGQPVYGVTSNKWSIPAGMGAVDSNGHYMGTIVTGFVIDALTKKLEAVINQQGVSFAIFDKEGILITASRALQSSPADINNLRLRLQHKEHLSGDKEGVLSAFFLFNKESQFSYYHIMPKYDYAVVTTYDRQLSQQAITQAIVAFMLESVVIAALIVLLLLAVRRLLVLPVLSLAAKAEMIAKGEKDVSIPLYKTYEMNLLGSQLAEIHAVRTELSKAHDEVRKINNTLEEHVAERTASLQDALNVRHDFLNHLSHEIRTPVSSIHARSDILLELWDEFNHVELKESIQDIQRNALQVCNLVTNLLDLSKSRAGKMVYTMQEHDVAVIAAEVVEECRPLYSRKSLHLTMENTAEHTVTLCDATKIGQVIRNLLSNACRYTPSGEVELVISNSDMHCEDGRIVPSIALSVTDEGVGIPEGEQHKIFESFTQSSRTNTKAGGTGLGLAIALEIITAHHGQIWAENNQATKGCAFIFLVPRQWSGC